MNRNIFTKHPNEVGMTYIEHFKFAFYLFRTLFCCSIASLVHAVFPFLFVTYTSTRIKQLNETFKKRIPAASAQKQEEPVEV